MKNFKTYLVRTIGIIGTFLVLTQSSYAQSCFGATAPKMTFTSSGGSLQRTIQIPQGCSGGTWAIIGSPSWLTSVSISGTTVYATAPAYSGYERSGSITLSVNGNTVGGIPVVQNEGSTPPPPPCIISGFSGSNFIGAGQTKNYTLSYSNCPSNIYFTFKQVVNSVEQDLPPWVTISQSSSTQISITFAQNSGTSSRSITIIGKRQDGGSPGIGGSFVQDCFQKSWYADSDNDGFRNPGSTAVLDCANRGSGWTLSTAVDNCPNDYSLTNIAYTWYPDSDGDGLRNPTGATIVQCNTPSGGPWTKNTTIDVCPTVPNTLAQNSLKTYYRDTDGDGFRDINGESRQACTPPTDGNWTTSQNNDNCPTVYYTSNNGCDPNCALTFTQNTALEFGAQGGSQTINFTVQSGCTGYDITFGPYDSWITVTDNSSPGTGSITVTVGAFSQFREDSGIGIYSNGSIQGGFSVKQNYVPPPCIVSGFGSGSVLPSGETKNFTLSYQDCPSESLYTFKDEDGDDINAQNYSWVSINHTVTNAISISFAANNTGLSRTLIVVGTPSSSGVSGIGANFTQPCIQQAWYADSDGDGFRDPGSVAQMDCLRTGNWTTNTIVDVCPTEPNANNVLLTWYRDTDGDGYKDPDGETREQCNEPTDGNWTSNPQPVDDVCPDYFNNVTGSNGCNPDCLYSACGGVPGGCAPFIVNPGNLAFESSGGTLTAEIELGCTSGYNIEIEPISGNTDNWLTVNIINGNILQVVCEAGTEYRQTNIIVRVNGHSGGGVSVTRNATPPPPPDPCTSDPIANISFDPFAHSQTINVVYSGDCTGTLFLIHPYNDEIDDWLSVDKSGLSFTLSVNNNSTGNTLTTVLIPVLEDTEGNRTPIGNVFTVTQTSCLTKWYLDTDGDGLGDVYGLPIIGCYDPDDDPDDDPNDSWVDNNDDLCPEQVGLITNNGCPEGTVPPENYNTISTKVFDVTETLKGAGKSYFDELGKPVQNQSWNIRTDDTWASETKYDTQGRPALQTLSAPIRPGNSFVYKSDFVLQSNNASNYGANNFTGTNLENPNVVGNATEGSLGWYYSDNNDREQYQDITSYPFVSSVYSTLNPGAGLRRLGGNKVDTNKNGTIDSGDTWAQAYAFTMRASDELSVSAAFGTAEYNDDTVIKTISRDVHGFENVVFSNTDGQLLASARSGSDGTTSPLMTLTINEQGYVDVHIPEGLSGITVSNSSAVTAYDLITELTVDGLTALENGFYRIAVNTPESYDPIGAPITVSYRVNYYDYSLNEYDEAGRLISTYQPLTNNNGDKLVTTFEYNTLGQLTKTTSVDEGTSNFIYREDGQIRFSQNSEQAKVNEVSFTDYDALGRPVESGVMLGATFSSLNGESTSGSNKKEQVFTHYDAIPASINITTILPSNCQSPRFLAGNVAVTTSGGGDYQTFYSYDVYGRVEWMAQHIEGLGIKTIDYDYNPITGQVEYVRYQKDDSSDRFIHKYNYDEANQLSMVQTSVDGTNWETHAEYFYYETGELKRTELAGGAQGLDYVYSLDGKLKALNHPSLNPVNDPNGDTNDLFGMQLDYHVGDYMRTSNTNIGQSPYGTDQLNGNIKGIRWKNASTLSGANESEYVYEYDRNSWLKAANFDPGNTDTSTGLLAHDESVATFIDGQTGTLKATQSYTLKPNFHAQPGSTVTISIDPNGGGASEGDFDVTNIIYDANGNIQSLTRNKGSQDGNNAMDNLGYNYKADKPNQLSQVTDDTYGGTGDAPNVDDIANQSNANNYVYNDIGQLVYNTSEEISYIYNTRGLVTEIKKGVFTLVKFYYNDRNHRIRKESFSPQNGVFVQNTYYLRDVAGQVMAIYSDFGGSITLKEQPVYGGGRIGVAYNGTNNDKQYIYEMTDHLGNVRAVFAKNGTDASLEGVKDYYPFGMVMPGRDEQEANRYRYAFQGQEKDQDTEMEAFELRLWDSRIGRWLTTDPYRVHASPYLGMANNPVSTIDPDGGCPEGWDCYNDVAEGSEGLYLSEVMVWGVNKLDSPKGLAGLDFSFSIPDWSHLDTRPPLPVGPIYPRFGADPLAPGASISMSGINVSKPIGIGVTLEGASPFFKSPITGNYGDAWSFGYTQAAGGQFYSTRKVSNDPGLAFGIGIDLFYTENRILSPMTAQRLEGYGSETGGGFFIGASATTDAIYHVQPNGTIMQKDGSYNTYGLNLGFGIDGFTNWKTHTRIHGN